MCCGDKKMCGRGGGQLTQWGERPTIQPKKNLKRKRVSVYVSAFVHVYVHVLVHVHMQHVQAQ